MNWSKSFTGEGLTFSVYVLEIKQKTRQESSWESFHPRLGPQTSPCNHESSHSKIDDKTKLESTISLVQQIGISLQISFHLHHNRSSFTLN